MVPQFGNGRFCLIVKEDAPFDVNSLRRFLFSKDIETRPIVAGNMTKQPAMAKIEHRAEGPFPNTDRIMERGFAIGNHHHVDSAARGYVIDTIREFINA